MTINLKNERLTNVVNCSGTTTLYTHNSSTTLKSYVKGFLFHNLSNYCEVAIYFRLSSDSVGSKLIYLAINQNDTVTFELPYPLILQTNDEKLDIQFPVGSSINLNVMLFGEKTVS
jgi:hypothetical protein